MTNDTFIAFSNNRIRAILIWGAITGIFSTVVYFGANEIASKNTHFYQLYFEFEKDIPMVPWMIYIYQSFALLIIITYLSIKSPQRIKAYSISFMSSCAIAAVFFILFPAELGFSRVENIKGYEFMYNTIHTIDRPHNLAPSLHIAYSGLGAYVLSSEIQSKVLKGMIWIWFLLICSSIVLVHQHHLFDIFSGAILALVVKYLIYDKLISTTNNAA
tara:strand:- start:2225 stop:2872 length:648 start_codon:yes stop_codon:yes gene_type:complete